MLTPKGDGGANVSWTNEQMEAISSIDLNSAEAKSLNIDFKAITKFLSIGNFISSNGWFNSGNKNSHWSLTYMMKISYINNEFDKSIIKMIGFAIKYGYSMELFDNFIEVTTFEDKSRTFKTWKCRQEIFDVFFLPDRLNDKSFNPDRVNYSKIDKKYVNEHLKLLLQLKKVRLFSSSPDKGI